MVSCWVMVKKIISLGIQPLELVLSNLFRLIDEKKPQKATQFKSGLNKVRDIHLSQSTDKSGSVNNSVSFLTWKHIHI